MTNQEYPKKIVFAGAIGGAIEFYDFTLYGALATFFAPIFFPAESKFISILSAYSVFAIGFFARPIGAAIFGHIGDLLGRKIALFWSLIVMACATLTIGLLPGYSSIGIFAPIIMIAVRIIQGLSAGGEYSGALILAIESGSKYRSGLIGSSITTGCMSGLVLGSIAAYICALPNMPEYVWRIPFIFGFIISIVGIYIRYKINESPLFLAEKNLNPSLSIKSTSGELKENFGNIISVIMLSGFNGIAIYLYFIYMSNYVAEFGLVTSSAAKLFTCIGITILMMMLLFFGWLSDHINRMKMIFVGGLLTIVSSFALLFFVTSISPIQVLLHQICFVVSLGMYSGPLNTFIIETFSTRVRYRFAAIGYSLGMGLIGGSAPLVASLLSLSKNNSLLIAAYIGLSGLCSLVCLWWMHGKLNIKRTIRANYAPSA